MNGAKWDALSQSDKDAIGSISGEALSSAWGKQFDIQNAAAFDRLGAAGHQIVDASPELIGAVDAIYDAMVASWIEAAKADGVADPAALLQDFQSSYTELAAK